MTKVRIVSFILLFSLVAKVSALDLDSLDAINKFTFKFGEGFIIHWDKSTETYHRILGKESQFQYSLSGQGSICEGEEVGRKTDKIPAWTIGISIGKRKYFDSPQLPYITPISRDYFTSYGYKIQIRIYRSNYLALDYDYWPAQYMVLPVWVGGPLDTVFLPYTEHIFGLEVSHRFRIYADLLSLDCGIGMQIISYYGDLYTNTGYGPIFPQGSKLMLPWMAAVRLEIIKLKIPLSLEFEVKRYPGAILWILDLLDPSVRRDNMLAFSLGLGYQFRR